MSKDLHTPLISANDTHQQSSLPTQNYTWHDERGDQKEPTAVLRHASAGTFISQNVQHKSTQQGGEKLTSQDEQQQQDQEWNYAQATTFNNNNSANVQSARLEINQASAMSGSDVEQQADNMGNENIEPVEFELEEELVSMVSVIFLKAVRRMITTSQVVRVYSIIKIILSTLLLIYSAGRCELNEYDVWVLLLVLQSFLAVIYSTRTIRLMKDVEFVEKLGFDLMQISQFSSHEVPPNEYRHYTEEVVQWDAESQEQVVEIMLLNFHRIPVGHTGPNSEEDYRKVQMVVLHLKYQCKRRDSIAMVSGYLQLLLYFGLQIWAVVQFFIIDDMMNQLQHGREYCHFFYYQYIFIIVLIGFFQYMDVYIIVTVTLVFSVFLIGALIIYLVKMCKKRRNRTSFIRSLKASKFKECEGENNAAECSICLEQFQADERIITLPCQAKHIFHEDCIICWLKVNSNCPMCRTTFQEVN